MPRDTPKEIRERDDRYRVQSRDHVARYIATGGRDGFDNNPTGAPTLILFTRGRRTGKEIATPLYYGQSGDRYVVIASYAGADAHPKWYLNLVADARVDVQVRDERFPAMARIAEGDERETCWALLADRFDFYNEYARNTEREIPVVILEPRRADARD
ncbi:MAG: nitroreductase/quinone reductase family protein [Thermomicrobiales bacterium]